MPSFPASLESFHAVSPGHGLTLQSPNPAGLLPDSFPAGDIILYNSGRDKPLHLLATYHKVRAALRGPV